MCLSVCLSVSVCLWAMISSVAWGYGATQALPWTTIVLLMTLWVFGESGFLVGVSVCVPVCVCLSLSVCLSMFVFVFVCLSLYVYLCMCLYVVINSVIWGSGATQALPWTTVVLLMTLWVFGESGFPGWYICLCACLSVCLSVSVCLCVCLWAIISSVAWGYGATQALPWTTVVLLMTLWVFGESGFLVCVSVCCLPVSLSFCCLSIVCLPLSTV